MTPKEISSSYDSSIIVRRWAGTWIDFLVLIAIFGFPAYYLGEDAFSRTIFVWIALAVAYFPILEGLTGRSLGKLLTFTKVVDAKGRAPGIGKAVIRTLARLIEVNPLLMGGVPAGLIALFSRSHQRLGDIWAGTYVLKTSDLRRLGQSSPPVYPEYAADPAYPPGRPADGRPATNTFPVVATLGTLGLLVVTLIMGALAYSFMHFGALEQREAQRFKQPVSLTYEQFLRDRPTEGWFRISGCQLSLAEAAYHESRLSDVEETASIFEACVPARSANPLADDTAALAVVTEDRDIMRSIEEIRKVDAKSDEKALEAWLISHKDQVFVTKTIEGMIRSEASQATSTQDQIKLLRTSLAPNYRVIEENAKPSAIGPRIEYAIGLTLAVLVVVFWCAWIYGLIAWRRSRTAS